MCATQYDRYLNKDGGNLVRFVDAKRGLSMKNKDATLIQSSKIFEGVGMRGDVMRLLESRIADRIRECMSGVYEEWATWCDEAGHHHTAESIREREKGVTDGAD